MAQVASIESHASTFGARLAELRGYCAAKRRGSCTNITLYQQGRGIAESVWRGIYSGQGGLTVWRPPGGQYHAIYISRVVELLSPCGEASTPCIDVMHATLQGYIHYGCNYSHSALRPGSGLVRAAVGALSRLLRWRSAW